MPFGTLRIAKPLALLEIKILTNKKLNIRNAFCANIRHKSYWGQKDRN